MPDGGHCGPPMTVRRPPTSAKRPLMSAQIRECLGCDRDKSFRNNDLLESSPFQGGHS